MHNKGKCPAARTGVSPASLSQTGRGVSAAILIPARPPAHDGDGLRTHGTNGTIHLQAPSLTSPPRRRRRASIKGAAAVWATRRRTSTPGLPPMPGSFLRIESFSHQKPKVRAGGRIQNPDVDAAQHPPSYPYACPFSATLADAIMAATPLRGVVDHGPWMRKTEHLERDCDCDRGDGGSLVPGLWPWQKVGDGATCKGSSKAAGAERGAGHSSDGASISKRHGNSRALVVSSRVNSDGGTGPNQPSDKNREDRFFFSRIYQCLL
jgi:hypothetical protein